MTSGEAEPRRNRKERRQPESQRLSALRCGKAANQSRRAVALICRAVAVLGFVSVTYLIYKHFRAEVANLIFKKDQCSCRQSSVVAKSSPLVSRSPLCCRQSVR